MSADSNHSSCSVANLLVIAVVIPTASCEHAEDSSHSQYMLLHTLLEDYIEAVTDIAIRKCFKGGAVHIF